MEDRRWTIPRALRRIACAALFAVALAGCAAPPPAPDRGLHIAPKANKNYFVEGRTLPFAELETLLARERPPRIVLETSRQRKGAACVVMLGIGLGIPVWTRSLNGAMREVKSDLKSSEFGSVDDCR
jgi:hypothetical protein